MMHRVTRIGALAMMLAVGGATGAAAQQDGPHDILQLRRLLVAHHWAALDSALAARSAEARADIAREGRYLFAFDAFASGDSLLQPHFDEWIASEPLHAVPRAARAVYFRAMAIAANRHGPTSNRDDEAYRELTQWIILARADARAARRLDPREIMGYAATLDLCETSAEELATVTRVWPGTVLLRARFMESISTICGGTLVELKRFAAAEQLDLPTYPRLRILSVLPEYHVAFDRAEKAGRQPTISTYSRAIARHDFWQLRYARAVEYLRIPSFELALIDLDRVIAERPGYAAALAWRGATLKELAKREHGEDKERLMSRAWNDIRAAVELNANDPQVAFILGDRSDKHTANSMP